MIRDILEVRPYLVCTGRNRSGGCCCGSPGPVISIQIENEYGCCGRLDGKKGREAHMRVLTKLALDAGLRRLILASTVGGPIYHELLPVMGGYCDAPWDRTLEKLPPMGCIIHAENRMIQIGKRFLGKRRPHGQQWKLYLTWNWEEGLPAHRTEKAVALRR